MLVSLVVCEIWNFLFIAKRDDWKAEESFF
jgi:hypothetical protein